MDYLLIVAGDYPRDSESNCRLSDCANGETVQRMIHRILPVLAFAVVLASPQSVSAASPKKTLAGFKGTYTGSSTVTGSTIFGSGTMTATITVPKNGRSAAIAFSGVAAIPGISTIPVFGTINLANGVATLSDLGLGLGEGTLYPGSGTYKVNSDKAVSFNAVNPQNGFTFTGTAKLTPQGRKNQKVTFNMTLVAPSAGAFNFVFTLSGKAPKLPK
jgi:hypothetical protein